MKRSVCGLLTILAAAIASVPDAQSQFVLVTPSPLMFGTHSSPAIFTIQATNPPTVISATVQCWGGGGYAIGSPTYPTGGGGGGAFASGVVALKSGETYTLSFGDFTQFAGIKAESGRHALSGSSAGAKGGQAVNSAGTTKFSGGDGGATFGIDAYGFSAGLPYRCGGGGGGASPTGPGINGTSGTALAFGSGGGNGGRGGAGQGGIGSVPGGNATLLISGGGAGGSGTEWRSGGRGLCVISP